MNIITEIRNELQRRIDLLTDNTNFSETAKWQIANYNDILDFIKQRIDLQGLPKVTLGELLTLLAGDNGYERVDFEVVGAYDGKLLFRSWNRKKLSEELKGLEVSTFGGHYQVSPRVRFSTDNRFAWMSNKDFLMSYYQITVLNYEYTKSHEKPNRDER